jgi:hypothetical protein
MINTITQRELFEIERKMWTNEPEFYSQILSKDVLLIFSDIGYISREDAIEAIKQEETDQRKWEFATFKNEKSQELTDQCYILSYMVKSKWNYGSEYLCAIASSVYIRVKNSWKLHLHQQTRISAEMYDAA